MTHYQQNNVLIQELRQHILADMKQILAKAGINSIEFDEDDTPPIVTMETEEDCINVQPSSIFIDVYGQLVFDMHNADCPQQIFYAISGENLYLEGLNDLLDALESKISTL